MHRSYGKLLSAYSSIVRVHRSYVVACEDAGGAAAIAPAVRALLARDDDVDLLLGPVAARTMQQRGVALRGHAIADAAAVRDRVAVASTYARKTALLTGTSCWGLRLEAHAVLAARRAGCPSLGILDFWSNYESRLSFPGPVGLAALPDLVAVIDSHMTMDVLEVGVPRPRIRVTGSPAFDALIAHRSAWVPVPGSVLFLSQPVSQLFGADEAAPTFLGYTEHTTLTELAPAVHAARGNLRVRPHPREDATALAAFVATLPCDAAVDGCGLLEEAVLQSRIVVGMTTMGLVEAALLGVPAISAQLFRRGPDGLVTNRLGLTSEVTTIADLRRIVTDALIMPPVATSGPVVTTWAPDATARVLAALDGLTTNTGS